MISAPSSLRRSNGNQVRFCGKLFALCALLLSLATAGSSLLADTNAAPVQPAPASAGEPGFGQYLVDHQDDLAPFFSRHSDELFKASIPILVGMATHLLFWTLVACWAVDVFLGRGFAAFFAPALTKLKRAIVYATGQFAIGMVFSFVFSLIVVFGSGMPYIDVAVPALAAILFLSSFAIQVGWVIYLYRTNPLISAAFYLGVLGVHLIVALIVAVPLLNGPASDLATTFMDQKITPQLRAEIDTTKEELSAASASRDKIKAESTEAQDHLTAAQNEATDLQKKIEEKKNSEPYLFSQIAKIHARGDLSKAHDQFTDFLVKFPSGALSDAARAQLDQVNTELAAQDAAQKQAAADAVQAAAKARADLLDRASKGQVTLSEAREALIGKTLKQVKDLFGLPSETASDRWGYGQRMIYDPLKAEKTGLAVNFSEGVVQGVDYYYGVAK